MPKRIGALISTVSFAFVSLTFVATVEQAAAQASRNATGSYSVNGFVLGAKVPSDSAQYRDYRCGPSEQFGGFTWCQRSRQERERRITSSLLHADDGKIAYLNRQEPASFDGREVDDEIRAFTRRLGSQPRITRLARRSGSPEGVLAMWGQVDVEPLDADSIRILADGKSPRKGFLVDYLGNLTRSAQDDLPVYRITGGPGLIWVASYDQRGRGTLRITAIDTSVLSPPVAGAPVPPPVVGDTQKSGPGAERSTELEPTIVADAKDGGATDSGATDAGADIKTTIDVPRLDAPIELQADAAPTMSAGDDTAQIANERAAADAEIARLRFAVGVSYSLIGGLLLLLAALFVRLLIEKRRRRLDRQARGLAHPSVASSKTRAPAEVRTPPLAPRVAVDPAAAPAVVAKDAGKPVEQVRSVAQPKPAPVAAAVAASPSPTSSTPAPASMSASAPASVSQSPAPTAVPEPVVQTSSLSIVPDEVPEHREAARPTDDGSIQRLAELSKLRTGGMLTESEFNQLKAAIIASVPGSQPTSP